MDFIINRLGTVLLLKKKYQRFGAWIMLLSSLVFFNIITWSPLLKFPDYIYSIAATSGGFLFGGLLAHGIQKTSHRFSELVGVNLYIIGWAFIVNSLLVANTYLEVYFKGVLGVYIVFLGIIFYFMYKENPTRVIVAYHLLLGTLLVVIGGIVFSLAYFETEISLFYLVRVGQLPAFWSHKAIVSILVGIGFLLISFFMCCLSPGLWCR